MTNVIGMSHHVVQVINQYSEQQSDKQLINALSYRTLEVATMSTDREATQMSRESCECLHGSKCSDDNPITVT